MADTVQTGKRDFRREVTELIVGMLEKGTAPWQRPWSPGAANAITLPHNAVSGRQYSGGNAMYLMAVGAQRGYDDPRWLTYDQAQSKGWQVRKGEQAAHVEFWQFDRQDQGQKKGERNGDRNGDRTAEKTGPSVREPATGTELAQSTKLERPLQRIYAVFNAQQMDGVPPLAPTQRESWQALEAADRALKHSGAKIVHRGDKAFYQLGSDQIVLPPKKAFADQGAYYGTALHELAHWSGHPERLNREGISGKHAFGSEGYAREELRAEMASVFLQAELGVPHNVERHASYVDHWIGVLKKDKNELFRAAKDAEHAADYVIELSKVQKLGQQLSDSLAEQAHGNATARYGELRSTALSGEAGQRLMAAAEHRELERLSRAHLGRPQDRQTLMERSPFAAAAGDKEKAQELDGALRELDYLANMPLHVAMARGNARDRRYVELRELDAVAYVDKQSGDLTIAAKSPDALKVLLDRSRTDEHVVVNDQMPQSNTWLFSSETGHAAELVRTPLARLGVSEGQIQRVAALTVSPEQRKQDLARSFQEADTQAKMLLGQSAKTYPAHLSEGLYRGPIIAQTALHVVQQVSANATVAHMKTAFGDIPAVDRDHPVRIPYNDGRAKALHVRPHEAQHEPTRSQSLSR